LKEPLKNSSLREAHRWTIDQADEAYKLVGKAAFLM
jgi:hypothetical protein